jgi:adenylate cyclase
MRKPELYRILFLVLFWELAVVFIVFYEGAMLGFQPPAFSPPGAVYDLGERLFVAVLITLVYSAAIGAFEVLYFDRLLRRMAFGSALLIKTVFYLMNIFIATSIVVILMTGHAIDTSPFDSEVWYQYLDYLSSPRLVAVMIYWGFVVSLALFLLQISQKFGQGVLLNFLTGKYHHPQEEFRIFMFLDLTSSTAYAEHLGHFKYSELLQDCFYDLTDVVVNHRAEIYQYVGDEVVLTWKRAAGVENNNCLNIFFDYDRVIRKRKEYYEGKYNVLPEFKAGVNAGPVTVAEVGEIKKELAYHGDALNTAARIRSACHEVKKRLLISDEVQGILVGIERSFRVESLGASPVKGKKDVVRLSSVELNVAGATL